MALINLKTNLKDLKFGNDEFGGESSGQPFVQTPIPATDEPLPDGLTISGGDTEALKIAGATIAGAAAGVVGAGITAGLAGLGILGSSLVEKRSIGAEIDKRKLQLPRSGTGGPDFLVRGGTLLPSIILDDEIRLSKFLTGTDGQLFIIKQSLLSRVAVRTQSSPTFFNGGTPNPLSILVQAAGLPFGTHANNKGLNVFRGINSSYTPDEYFDAVAPIGNDPENRLKLLYEIKVAGSITDGKTKGNIKIKKEDTSNVLSYGGGPNSFLGVGNTNISFASNNEGLAPLRTAETPTINTDSKNPYATLSSFEISGSYENIESQHNPSYVIDFRKKLREKQDITNNQQFITSSGIIINSPDYQKQNIETRVSLGDPGNRAGKNLTSYVSGYATTSTDPLGAASVSSYDEITYLPIYQSNTPNVDVNTNTKDLVQFRIGVYDLHKTNIPKNYIHFRAFLNSISDTYNADWNSTQYIGRGEKFYNYNGFDRKVSLSWTVAAQSKAELIPMYRKLNYLASVCAPDYSTNGYMRGNIVNLTIGGYFYEQPGIITGLSYEMNDDNATWEIGIDDKGGTDTSVNELPHLIKVNSFNFIPIHNFVPKLQQLDFNDDGSLKNNPYGPERFIALNSGTTNNDNYNTVTPTPSTTSATSAAQ